MPLHRFGSFHARAYLPGASVACAAALEVAADHPGNLLDNVRARGRLEAHWSNGSAIIAMSATFADAAVLGAGVCRRSRDQAEFDPGLK